MNLNHGTPNRHDRAVRQAASVIPKHTERPTARTEDQLREMMLEDAREAKQQGKAPHNGGKVPLTPVQQEVLALFEQPRTAREIADAMGMDVHQAHNNIRSLKDKGLIVRAGSDGLAAIYERRDQH